MFDKDRKRNWTVNVEDARGSHAVFHIYGMSQDAAVKAAMADERVKNSYHWEFKDGIHKAEDK